MPALERETETERDRERERKTERLREREREGGRESKTSNFLIDISCNSVKLKG